MSRAPSLAWRLALAFALVCAVVLGAIGFYLYRSLERELAFRDDQALLGRVEQVRILLQDSDSLEGLQERPRLYQNMLGNRESLLRVLRADGTALIDINPAAEQLPKLPALAADRRAQRGDLRDWRAADGTPARLLAVAAQGPGGEPLHILAGKLMIEREQMLASYRWRLYGGVGGGALLALLLGLGLVRRGLAPLRRLAGAVAGIDRRSLDRRLPLEGVPEELHAPIEALNAMLARLEDSVQRLSQFSADLAHEIRTPLHNLLGSNQLALGQPRSQGEYEELLASNLEEYERLIRMAENLLFLARVDNAQQALERREVALDELGEQLVDYFEALASERGLHLDNRLHGQLCADRLLLQRALGNLLANAIRHAEADSTILLERHDGAGLCWLAVDNRGAAIPAEHLPRLFDRFFRADPSRAAPGDSGGLGLAIVKSIAELHGGRVEVLSGDGRNRFAIGLPPVERCA